MIVHVITLFPEQIEAYVSGGILGRAREAGLLEINTVQLRDFAVDKHHSVDDYPYGGGAGMILKPEPLTRAIRHVEEKRGVEPGSMFLAVTSPQGRMFDAAVAREYSRRPEWIVVCGHYGGMDQRVLDHAASDEISIGDYVLTGGELPALAMIDAAARFVPGVLGNEDSAQSDTFEDGLLGAPLYTRPPDFEGREVPEVLLSGNHARIDLWRRKQKLRITARRRPDLLEKASLSSDDEDYVNSLEDGAANIDEEKTN